MKRRLSISLGVLALVELGLATSAWAQIDRGWVDFNFGANRVAEREYDTAGTIPTAGGQTVFGTSYVFPQGPAADFGAGYMINEWFGVGGTIVGSRNREKPMLSVNLPGGSASAQAITPLDRFDVAYHIQAVWNVLPDDDRWRVHVYGGPTIFHVIHETVDTITFSPLIPSGSVNITSFTFSESDANGFGGHLGGDVSYFLGPNMGFGGFVRVSGGSVDLIDYSGTFKVKTGRLQYGGGLRLRF